MGKRELLLIAAFLAVGAVAYRLTAPAGASEGGFSIGGLIHKIRSELRGQNYELQALRSSSVEAPTGVTTVRIDDFRGVLMASGEDRADVAVELQTAVFGADEAQARQFERTTTVGLELEPDGHTLGVRIGLASDEMRRRPRMRLHVKMPKRLGLRLAINGGEIEISQVGAVTLDRGSGKAVITGVKGAVAGEFGPGEIEIDRAGSVELELRRADARLMDIAGRVTVEAQSGDVRLRNARGPTALSLRRVAAEAEDVTGPLTVEGSGGDLRVRNIRAPVTAKVERMEVSLAIAAPVPIEASTTGDTLDVTLPPGGFRVEATATDGQIRASGSNFPVSTVGTTQRTTATIGGGGPLVKLETSRGDIVIR